LTRSLGSGALTTCIGGILTKMSEFYQIVEL
jgi:hypothetical protein